VAGIYDIMGVVSATQAQRPKWRRSDVPKPLRRPWDVIKEVKKLGGKPKPLRDIQKRLGWDKRSN